MDQLTGTEMGDETASQPDTNSMRHQSLNTVLPSPRRRILVKYTGCCQTQFGIFFRFCRLCRSGSFPAVRPQRTVAGGCEFSLPRAPPGDTFGRHVARTRPRTDVMNDPKPCVVLVPVGHHVEPACEDGLRKL